MGSFIHYCKYCNAKLNVDNGWLGKSMKCPACGKKITFPNADGSTAQSVPTIELGSNSDMPLPPDFPSAPDMPSPPVAKPEAPVTAAAPVTGSGPRRIKLKPLAGAIETVPSEPRLSVPTAKTEIPDPPPVTAKPFNTAAAAAAAPATAFAGKANDVPPTKPAGAAAKSLPDTVMAEPRTALPGNVVEPAVKGFFKGAYFWGRLGSAWNYFLAAATVVAGFYFSLHLYWNYRSNEDLIPEKQLLSDANKELNIREKKLNNQFKNAVNLLQGSGNISANGVLDGVFLADNAMQRPDPMPLGVLSTGELQMARKVLEQYKECNKKLKAEFVKCFGNAAVLQKQGNAAVNTVPLTQIVLQAGEVKKQFFANEQIKQAQLSALENIVNEARKQFAASGKADSAELKRLAAASSFVRRQLFPVESNITIVKSNSKPAAAGSAANDLSQAVNLIAALANDWQLDLEIANMEMLLEKVPTLTNIYEKKKNAYLQEMGKNMVSLWIRTLLAAFAFLVLGDVLRGFFDMADAMRRGEGKR